MLPNEIDYMIGFEMNLMRKAEEEVARRKTKLSMLSWLRFIQSLMVRMYPQSAWPVLVDTKCQQTAFSGPCKFFCTSLEVVMYCQM